MLSRLHPSSHIQGQRQEKRCFQGLLGHRVDFLIYTVRVPTTTDHTPGCLVGAPPPSRSRQGLPQCLPGPEVEVWRDLCYHSGEWVQGSREQVFCLRLSGASRRSQTTLWQNLEFERHAACDMLSISAPNENHLFGNAIIFHLPPSIVTVLRWLIEGLSSRASPREGAPECSNS